MSVLSAFQQREILESKIPPRSRPPRQWLRHLTTPSLRILSGLAIPQVPRQWLVFPRQWLGRTRQSFGWNFATFLLPMFGAPPEAGATPPEAGEDCRLILLSLILHPKLLRTLDNEHDTNLCSACANLCWWPRRTLLLVSHANPSAPRMCT